MKPIKPSFKILICKFNSLKTPFLCFQITRLVKSYDSVITICVLFGISFCPGLQFHQSSSCQKSLQKAQRYRRGGGDPDKAHSVAEPWLVERRLAAELTAGAEAESEVEQSRDCFSDSGDIIHHEPCIHHPPGTEKEGGHSLQRGRSGSNPDFIARACPPLCCNGVNNHLFHHV